MIAVGYVRRSSPSKYKKKHDGAGAAMSLEVQREAIAHYCEKQGLTLAAVVSHDGISGTKGSRFEEIKRAVLETHAKAVVVYNLDRLARDDAGLLAYLRGCTRAGVEVHETSSGKLDFKRSLGKLVVSVRGAMDEFYAAVIGEKTADALRYKKSQLQQYTKDPPFGWKYENKAMVIEPEEQRALGLIDLCRQQGLGATRTIKFLRGAGYIGRGGKSTVQKLLKGKPDES